MAPRRLLDVLALAVVLLAPLATTGPARADDPVEHRSAAYVTRLTLDATGRGYLTVQVRLRSDRYGGFDLYLGPDRTDGQWIASADVVVPGLGIYCLRRGEAGDLVYDCGRAGHHEQPGLRLPAGDYRVTIPVRWTGSPSAVFFGNLILEGDLGAGDYGSIALDSFKIHDATWPRSTAEVVAAQLDDQVTADGHAGQTTVVADLDVAAGEEVTFVDVDLPYLTWRLVGTNAAGHGLDCWVRTSPLSGRPSGHCRSRTADSLLPTGRYAVVLTLDYTTTDFFPDDALGYDGYVRLGVGHPADAVDHFDLATGGPW